MTNYRRETETKLAYWIMGIGFILWDKVQKIEVGIVKTQEDADDWVDDMAELAAQSSEFALDLFGED